MLSLSDPFSGLTLALHCRGCRCLVLLDVLHSQIDGSTVGWRRREEHPAANGEIADAGRKGAMAQSTVHTRRRRGRPKPKQLGLLDVLDESRARP